MTITAEPEVILLVGMGIGAAVTLALIGIVALTNHYLTRK